MNSLIEAYACVLMPNRGVTDSGTAPTGAAYGQQRPADPLSLSFSALVYRAICWLERVATSRPTGAGS